MKKQIIGQIDIFGNLYGKKPHDEKMGLCSECICFSCLYYKSLRCPYGGCWDDFRASMKPYNICHPNKPQRNGWSNFDKPGEQAHWCRGGIFYIAQKCNNYIKYKDDKTKVVECLGCSITVFQDGYKQCSIIDSVGCEKCYEEFLGKVE